MTVGHTQVLTMALSYVRAAKVLGGYSDIAKWLVEHDECADYLDVTVPGSREYSIMRGQHERLGEGWDSLSADIYSEAKDVFVSIRDRYVAHISLSKIVPREAYEAFVRDHQVGFTDYISHCLIIVDDMPIEVRRELKREGLIGQIERVPRNLLTFGYHLE